MNKFYAFLFIGINLAWSLCLLFGFWKAALVLSWLALAYETRQRWMNATATIYTY